MFQKPTEVSPVVRELMKSVSVVATRPKVPRRASSFANSNPGSIFRSLPPRWRAKVVRPMPG